MPTQGGGGRAQDTRPLSPRKAVTPSKLKPPPESPLQCPEPPLTPLVNICKDEAVSSNDAASNPKKVDAAVSSGSQERPPRKKFKRKTEKDLLYKTFDDLWARKDDIKTLVMQNFKETHITRSSERHSASFKTPQISENGSKMSSLPQGNKPKLQATGNHKVIPPLKCKNVQTSPHRKDKNPVVVKICPSKPSKHHRNNNIVSPPLSSGGISLDHCYAKPQGHSWSWKAPPDLCTPQLMIKKLELTVPPVKSNGKLEEKENKTTAAVPETRKEDCTFHYNGILVQKKKNFMQITFKQSNKTHNFLTLDALVELRETLEAAVGDPLCQVLVFRGSNNTFCSGIDLRPLLGDQRIQAAQDLVRALGRLIRTLAEFSKPVVGAVSGLALGLGVTLLTYCDVVVASEGATFQTPYAELGFLPEGAGTVSLPRTLGPTLATDMFLRGRALTASQALAQGLVSYVVPPTQLHQQLLAQVHSMAARNTHVLETTKALLRTPLLERLEESLRKEEELLPSQWLSTTTQQAIQAALDTGVLRE